MIYALFSEYKKRNKKTFNDLDEISLEWEQRRILFINCDRIGRYNENKS